MKFRIVFFLFLFPLLLNAQPIRVGAKHFTEGYILGEIIAQLLESHGYKVDRKFNLGGTMIAFKALQNDQIDIYPEYTGTLSLEILNAKQKLSLEEINLRLQKFQLEITNPYGFSNTYALVMKKDVAKRISITSIEDLQRHRDLRVGLSYEFLKREDGWKNLSKFYKLEQLPTGLEHGIAYKALDEHKIDVTDAYSTDGEIQRYDLLVLKDNKNFFPDYLATSLISKNLDPEVKNILQLLSGQISEQTMQQMNASVVFNGKSFKDVASEFLKAQHFYVQDSSSKAFQLNEVVGKILVHIKLTFIALLMAVIVGVPVGILLYWYQQIAKPILYLAGLLQTIPSIALLAILLPFTGIGAKPAIISLFLYALLPILRNTVTGLRAVDSVLKKVAVGMGMNAFQRIHLLEFPLAMPTIISGIRTAAVINVGTATLAAFIGAGGLGEFIVSGLALNNTALILRGAIPAALLAIVIELLFEGLEKMLKRKHIYRG